MAKKSKDGNQLRSLDAIDMIIDQQLSGTEDITQVRPEYIKTGLLIFDMLLGGGILKNRVFMLGADTGVGKTTLCIQTARNFIQENLDKGNTNVKVLYIDAENSLTVNRFLQLGIKAEWLGLDPNTLQPDKNLPRYLVAKSGFVTWQQIEKILDAIYTMLSREETKTGMKPEFLIVLDSIPAIKTPDMIEKSLDESEQPGQMAKMVGRLIEKLITILPHMNATVIAVNHVRPVIQAMPMQPISVGSLVKSGMRMPGGTKLQYYASQIVSLKEKKRIEWGGFVLKVIEARTWKNRAFASDKAEFLVYNDLYGFSDVLTMLLFLQNNKLITNTRGRWVVQDEEWTKKYQTLAKPRSIKEIIKDYQTDSEFRQAFYDYVYHHAYELLVKPYILEEQLPTLTEVLSNADVDIDLNTTDLQTQKGLDEALIDEESMGDIGFSLEL